MAATGSSAEKERTRLNELLDEFEDWRVLGNWLPVKKLEIVIGPYRFESLRPALQELALSDLEVSELRVFGKTSSKKYFYRCAEHVAPAQRIKIGMLVTVDCVANVITLLSGAAEPLDDDRAEIHIFDAAGAVHTQAAKSSRSS